MSNPKNDITKILEISNSRLSYDTLEKYIAGTLSYKEQHLVEKEVLANELLADALEGLRASRSNIAREKVGEIDVFIEGLVGKQEKRIPYGKLTAIAAGALILIVGSVALFNLTGTNENTVAQSEAVEADDKESKVAAPEIVEAERLEAKSELEEESEVDGIEGDNTLAEVEQEDEAPMPLAPEEEAIAEEKSIVVQDCTVTNNLSKEMAAKGLNESDMTITGSVQRSMSKDQEEVLLDLPGEMLAYSKLSLPVYNSGDYKNNDAGYGVDSYNFKTYDESDKKKQSRKSEAKPQVNFYEEAITAYRGIKFKEAASKFDIVLSSDPSNPTALMYGGVAHFKNGNYSRAESLLTSVSSDKKFGSHAKWYLATLYLKIDKERKAKKTLKALDSDAIYGVEATKILGQL